MKKMKKNVALSRYHPTWRCFGPGVKVPTQEVR